MNHLLVPSKTLEVEKRVEVYPVGTETRMVMPVPIAKAGLFRGQIVCCGQCCVTVGVYLVVPEERAGLQIRM